MHSSIRNVSHGTRNWTKYMKIEVECVALHPKLDEVHENRSRNKEQQAFFEVL